MTNYGDKGPEPRNLPFPDGTLDQADLAQLAGLPRGLWEAAVVEPAPDPGGGGSTSTTAVIDTRPPALTLTIARPYPDLTPVAAMGISDRLLRASIETIEPGGWGRATFDLRPASGDAHLAVVPRLPATGVVDDMSHIVLSAGTTPIFVGVAQEDALDGTFIEAQGYGTAAMVWGEVAQGGNRPATIGALAAAALRDVPWIALGRIDDPGVTLSWAEYANQPSGAVIESLCALGDGNSAYTFYAYERASFVAKTPPRRPDYLLDYDPEQLREVRRSTRHIRDWVRMRFRDSAGKQRLTQWFVRPGYDASAHKPRKQTLAGSAESATLAARLCQTYLAQHSTPRLSGPIVIEGWHGLTTPDGEMVPGYLVRAGQWLEVAGYGTAMIRQTLWEWADGEEPRLTVNLGDLDQRSTLGIIRLARQTNAAIHDKRDPVTGAGWRW